ncbi:hypothetical protein Ocin01_16231 [Orchesella cincta]|uniref:Uncharacterized protein n=1 Tax=Orchesella cincta TaxID=48709 RepID=A0A1D2MC14_ORCCI|nr:hypothetical protein Ocin01_16231 [Orchesella cincta]
MDLIGLTLVTTGVLFVAALLFRFFFSTQKFRNGSVTQHQVTLEDASVPFSANEISNQILSFHENLREDEDQLATIQKVQTLLISARNEIQDDFDTRNSLIIGVDATPHTQAGYCVNPFDKSIRFYVLKRADFPWKFDNEKDPAEFEMKNLMFALTIWKNQIIWLKQLSIYTDNFAGVFGSQYGVRAMNYLQHFVDCEGVTVVNRKRMALNKYQSLPSFAKYIQPADDLSRWKIDAALEFLTKMYDIDMESVQGTHQKVALSSTSKPRYKLTPFSKRICDSANRVIAKGLRCGNPVCSTAAMSLVLKNEI